MADTKKAADTPSPARKKRRGWKFFAVVGLLLMVGLVAGLPWLLGTPPGRAWLVGKVNAQIAPGKVELERLGLSWTGPIELWGVALVDPKGKKVLTARSVTLDRGILGLIASRPDYGTITVEGVAVDVERRADGSIDIIEALGPLMASDAAPPQNGPGAAAPSAAPAPPPAPSKMAASVLIKGGTLKVSSPELVEPISARSFDGSATILPGKPMELVAHLVDDGRTLELRSAIGPATAGDMPADLSASATGKGWPIHVREAGVEALGRFDGTLSARREKGLWTLNGVSMLAGVVASGPALQGDKLALDKVSATCDIAQSSTGWTIRKLEVTSPVASIEGSGVVPAVEGNPSEVRGRVDLAALAKMLPNAMRLRDGLTLDRGTANLKLDLTTLGGAERFEVVASLDDFAATEAGKPIQLRQQVVLSGKASRIKEKIAVEVIQVKAAGVDVKGSGDLESGVKLLGTIDLAPLVAQVRDVIDLGAYDAAGLARIGADYKHTGDSFKGRIAAEIKGLKVSGATAEPVVRDLVRLDASATGSSKPDGMPGDWREVQLDLKAGDLKVDLLATSKPGGGEIDLAAGAGMDVASPVPGRLAAKTKLRKLGTLFEVAELRGGITPSDPSATHGAVAIAVQGRFDSASGAGAFTPIPGTGVGAIGLGIEGAKLSGVGIAGAPMKVDASLIGDLAALDLLMSSWWGEPLKGWSGDWASKATASRTALGKLDVEGRFDAPNIVAVGLKGPVTLIARAGYAPDLDRLEVPAFALATSYGQLGASGEIKEVSARRYLSMGGTFAPDWKTVDHLVTTSVEPKAKVRATVRPFRLEGMLKADTTAQLIGQLAGEIGVDVTTAEAFGVKLGKTPIVLKIGGGGGVFEPIVTTMNDGPVLIQGRIVFDKTLGAWLVLQPSRIEGAAINEAVSNSILAYAAPVLAKSSNVSGKVTVALEKGSIPITATGAMSLDCAVAFQNTVFKPGSLAAELAAITGQPSPTLKLDQTMIVQVANGRVKQTGLSIPVGGNGMKVAIDGSVGFDETLDLKATIPVSARLLGLDASLDKSIPATTIPLPIRGTLARPSIDQRAFGVAVRNAAKDAGTKELKKELNNEAGKLLNRIAGPNQAGGEPRSKPNLRNPLGGLESLGREILDPSKRKP